MKPWKHSGPKKEALGAERAIPDCWRDGLRAVEKMEFHSDSENWVTESTFSIIFINEDWRINRTAALEHLDAHLEAKDEGH